MPKSQTFRCLLKVVFNGDYSRNNRHRLQTPPASGSPSLPGAPLSAAVDLPGGTPKHRANMRFCAAGSQDETDVRLRSFPE